jgi:hypothetical protein
VDGGTDEIGQAAVLQVEAGVVDSETLVLTPFSRELLVDLLRWDAIYGKGDDAAASEAWLCTVTR